MNRRDFLQTSGILTLAALVDSAIPTYAAAKPKNEFAQFIEDVRLAEGVADSQIVVKEEKDTHQIFHANVYLRASSWNLDKTDMYMGELNQGLKIVELTDVLNSMFNSEKKTLFMAAPEKGVHFTADGKKFDGSYLLIGSYVDNSQTKHQYDNGFLKVTFTVDGKTAEFQESSALNAAYKQIVKNLR